MKAIIIAAGQGKRLNEYTKETPKCLLLTYAKVIGLLPRQLRSMNTGPQQFGRMLKPPYRFRQRIFEINKISGNTIGQSTFQMIPNPFIRIQLRGIGRESESTNLGMFFKPSLGLIRPMRGAAIPENNKTFRQMPLEMPQEFNDLRPTDVLLRMQPDVKVNPFALWRHADSRDRRNLAPTSSRRQNRRLSSGSPRPLHRRNQGEAALVEKYQRNLSTQSVFLYAATGTSSTFQLPGRFVLAPYSQAFDNSNPIQLKFARHDSDGIQPQNGALLLQLSFGLSTILLHTRSSPLLAIEYRPASFAAFHSASLAVLVLLATLVHFHLAVDAVSANSSRHLLNIPVFGLLPAVLFLFPATRLRAGVASQGALGFHVVSWNQINTDIQRSLLLLRKSIRCMSIMAIRMFA